MAKKTEIEQVKEELARVLGEDPANITVENPKWIQLMKEGVLVNLDIGRWRGKTQLSWRDLGIGIEEEDKQLRSLINLGHKILLPKEFLKKMDSLETKARYNLQKLSYKTYWGMFIPVTAYGQWKEVNEEIREEYLQVANDLAEVYEDTIEDMIRAYEVNGAMAYRHFQKLYPEELKRFKDKEAFMEAFLFSIKSHIKSKGEFLESIHFNARVTQIPLPSMLKDDLLLAEEREAEYFRSRVETEKQEQLARIEVEKAEGLKEEEIRAKRTTEDIREQQLREMNQDLINQLKKEKEEEIDSFIQDMVVNLRSLVYESSLDVLGAIKKAKTAKKEWIHPRSVVQLKTLIDQVNSLNVYGDQEINSMLSRVTAQLSLSPEARSLEDINRTIKDIAIISRSSLMKLEEGKPRTDRGLGLFNNPIEKLERNSRKRLGLDDILSPDIKLKKRGERGSLNLE